MKKYLEILVPVFRVWLPLGVGITVVSVIAMGVGKMSMRQSGNDPQVQIAEDVANYMSAGQSAETIIPPNYVVDMSRSLAPFVAIYDDTGKVLAGSVRLEGEIPTPPMGVLDHARSKGRNTVSWQPVNGVRAAIIVVRYESTGSSGFVLAGRSLREIERREKYMMLAVLLGWGAALVLSFGTQFAVSRKKLTA